MELRPNCVQEHKVFVYDRGGRRRLFQLVNLSQVRWGRVRDDVSQAEIRLEGEACADNQGWLSRIEPKRHELVIFRGTTRVWEGPIWRVAWHETYVTISAHDCFEYLNARPLSKTWDTGYHGEDDDRTTSVTKRAQDIITYELTHPFSWVAADGTTVTIPGWEEIDPPANVLPHLVVHRYVDDARTSSITSPFQMSVGEHIDNMARSSGLDYTVVGRAIHLWDVHRAIGRGRQLTSADFDADVVVTAYGADHAEVAFVVADDGRYGGAVNRIGTWNYLGASGPAGDRLTIPTYVSPPGGQTTHPSVVDFGAAWNGYRFWMAHTPYPGGDDSYENPSIVASNDGETWTTPTGLTNPIDEQPGSPGPYNSDVDLVRYGSGLALFWRTYVAGDPLPERLYVSTSANGRSWSPKRLIWQTDNNTRILSPTFIYENGGWTMFGVDIGGATNRLARVRSTVNLIEDLSPSTWGAVQHISISLPAGKQPWHVFIRPVGSQYIGLLNDADENTQNGDIYVITSPDGLNWSRGASPAIPRNAPSHNSLYRATFTVGGEGVLDVWYAGWTTSPVVWNIFRTTLSAVFVPGGSETMLDYYGPWTKMYTVYDEDESNPPTQADLNSQAQRNLSGRSPVPTELRVPENSTIRLSESLTIEDLVPGVRFPVAATLNARRITQMLKLHTMQVTETGDGETITVSFVSASNDDSDEGASV